MPDNELEKLKKTPPPVDVIASATDADLAAWTLADVAFAVRAVAQEVANVKTTDKTDKKEGIVHEDR